MGIKKISSEDLIKSIANVSKIHRYNDLIQTKLIEKMKGDLRKIGSIDFQTLNINEQEIYLDAIVGKMRPDMYDNPNYLRVVANYYEGASGHEFYRRGEPVLDEDGHMKWDNNGGTIWIGGWNGRYGGMDKNMFTQSYLRDNRFEMVKKFDNDGAEIFFRNRDPGNRNLNYDITYDEVVSHLNKTDPSGYKTEEFQDDIANLRSTSYSHLIKERPESYEKLRTAFINQLKNDVLRKKSKVEKNIRKPSNLKKPKRPDEIYRLRK